MQKVYLIADVHDDNLRLGTQTAIVNPAYGFYPSNVKALDAIVHEITPKQNGSLEIVPVKQGGH